MGSLRTADEDVETSVEGTTHSFEREKHNPPKMSLMHERHQFCQEIATLQRKGKRT